MLLSCLPWFAINLCLSIVIVDSDFLNRTDNIWKGKKNKRGEDDWWGGEGYNMFVHALVMKTQIQNMTEMYTDIC